MTAVATSRTHQLLAGHTASPEALTSGFQRGLIACTIFLLIAAVVASRATNTRSAPVPNSDRAPLPTTA